MAPTESLREPISHYQLLEVLGQGGMGVVYRAVDLRLGRTVALKLLAPHLVGSETARRRLWREARAISALDHPNICTLYEIGEAADGGLFLAMAFCGGETLARRIARGPLPSERAVDFAQQVAAGLAAAHEQGIVHRDIKPSNLIVAPDGRLKIVDFGIARRADETLLTQAGLVQGTTAYMAPEQLRGGEIDGRADLWALGVVLYEMLTGERPFSGPQPEVVAAIFQRDPRPLCAVVPEVPAALESIVERSLAKAPSDRYPSAAALHAALAAAWLEPRTAAIDLEPTLVERIEPRAGNAASVEETPATHLYRGTQVAQFRIEAVLGGGGMGVVYRAEDTRLGRTVALKFIAPERTREAGAKEEFLREARAASALDHPNVCTVHEVGETAEGRLFLAMPCYDGETLAERLERGPLPAGEAVELALQAARGLAKAHRQGFVHRDVKPANLIVTGDGVLKVLDFGIAQLAGQGGAGAGTPAYMSPEQVRGETVDAASDVWALGVVLYEMLSGARPFGGDSRAAVFRAILEDEPAPLQALPAVPAEVARLVGRLLAKDPAGRFSDAGAMLPELSALAASAAAPTGASGDTGARAAARRRAVTWGTGSLLVLLGLGAIGLGVLLRSRAAGDLGAPLQATFTHLTDQEGRELFPSLAPDDKSFVYTKNVNGRSHIFRQPLAAGAPPEDLSPRFSDSHAVYSPDGRQLAFRSEREGGGIFLMRAEGGEARRLTDSGFDPAWSPDGQEIAYATEGVVDPSVRRLTSRLWIVRVASGERRLLSPVDAVQPSFSPDGRRIAYWNTPAGSGQRHLWTVPVAGGPPRKVLADEHVNWDPVWSPDGRYLYFASDRGGSMNLWRLRIEPSSGEVRGAPEPLTAPAQWSGMMAISRDGKRLLYATDDGRSNIERVDLDPRLPALRGTLQPVTEGSRAVRSFDVSPDGHQLVFATTTPQEDLFIVGSHGGPVRQLTRDAAKDRSPRWSPDGSRIVFYSNRDGTFRLWSIRPDGGGLARIDAATGEPLYGPIWSPDGGRLVYLHGAGKEPQTMMLLDLRAPQPRPVALSTYTFSPVAWSADGRALLGASLQGVEMYSLATGRFELLAPSAALSTWLAGSRRLLYSTGSAVVALDRSSREARELIRSPAGAEITSLAVSRDGGTLYVVRSVSEGDVWMLTLG